ncbi:Lipase/lipooxygenase, putative isoform 2 [Hibiscus syriacus]|uniref:Lipase/lipooxygenase, putative isoform 2 n=1 Tax=Hibiscus syriacus TaxID=106335 RepID=A0A6A2WLC4_HIBSY|nr:Lipase/lipooxygenase, putative isoform 2 [Hibiscus syriacus]
MRKDNKVLVRDESWTQTLVVMAMESIPVSRTIFATNQRNPFRMTPIIHSRRSFHSRTACFRFRFITSYKRSDFQDFQGFVKPSRLLPSTEPKVCTGASKEKIISSTGLNGARAFYKVWLQTSNMYGSSLSNINAGILLCLIDEKGNSILQRIPASLFSEHPTELKNTLDPETLHFERGSIDEFVFEGAELGKVKALWIGVESDDGESLEHGGVKYDFEVDDILLGEGGDDSMVELRPFITELSGQNILVNEGFSQPTSSLSDRITNEKSMKEYADLKFSLLLYDAVLIVVGTSFASFSIGESSAFAFLLGGIVGFLYLWSLQRGPVSSLALAIALSSLAIKYSMSDVPFELTPKELLVGMMGFLVCKVAVFLAAFKPLPLSVDERK